MYWPMFSCPSMIGCQADPGWSGRHNSVTARGKVKVARSQGIATLPACGPVRSGAGRVAPTAVSYRLQPMSGGGPRVQAADRQGPRRSVHQAQAISPFTTQIHVEW